MTYEFEGENEDEAVQNAIEALHIEKQDFEYEVIKSTARGLFKKPVTRIRVRIGGIQEETANDAPSKYSADYDDEEEDEIIPADSPEPKTDKEKALVEFVTTLTQKIDLPAKVNIVQRSASGKVYLDLLSADSQFLIGHHGKMLDALQVVVNGYCQNISTDEESIKAVVDVEGYRERHESKIIKDAINAARNVRKSGKSVLLEPLNPYERRLVHRALTKFGGVETESQGSGIEKRIKITKC